MRQKPPPKQISGKNKPSCSAKQLTHQIKYQIETDNAANITHLTFLIGPALYAFNNAVFTEDDWHGIQATGRSVKRDDPNKVGRFGIGFNSIYHITG